METGYDFDVLRISYSHDRTDVQYLGGLRRMAIAAAELRIAAALFRQASIKQQTALSSPATRQCTGNRGRDPTSWAGISLSPLRTG
jgi:hypothetical protein